MAVKDFISDLENNMIDHYKCYENKFTNNNNEIRFVCTWNDYNRFQFEYSYEGTNENIVLRNHIIDQKKQILSEPLFKKLKEHAE